MLRGRPLDEDDDVETAQLPSKRTTTGLNGEVEHYDIYALPSSAPLFPGASATSIALVVVSSSRGLSNLGLRFGVRGAQDAASGALAIALERDAGFFLPREPSYDASRAVLLGWVEIDALGALDAIIASTPLPPLNTSAPGSTEARDWLLSVAQRLEMEGILANPEIVLSDFLRG